MAKKKSYKTVKIFFVTVFAVLLFIEPLSARSSEKRIELSFAHSIPSTIPAAKVYIKWAENIFNKTDGRVKIDYYWSHSLLRDTELYRGVKSGVADMGVYYLGVDQGIFVGNSLMLLGFLGYPSTIGARDIYSKLRNKFPELRKEFEGLKLLGVQFTPGQHFHFTRKSVRVPADLRGLKIITKGSARMREVAQLGAVPIEVSAGDYYISLERGMADGIDQHFPVVHAFGVLGEVRHNTLFGAGMVMAPTFILINADRWERLPDDIKRVFEEEREWLEQELCKADGGYEQMVLGKIKKDKHKITILSPEEIELWQKAVQPAHDKIIAEIEAKGIPARAIVKEIKRLAREYSD